MLIELLFYAFVSGFLNCSQTFMYLYVKFKSKKVPNQISSFGKAYLQLCLTPVLLRPNLTQSWCVLRYFYNKISIQSSKPKPISESTAQTSQFVAQWYTVAFSWFLAWVALNLCYGCERFINSKIIKFSKNLVTFRDITCLKILFYYG